ncbi:unnamed protein product, partial [Lymnaea stagnalis]
DPHVIVFLAVLSVIISAFTVLANFTVILAIFRSRDKESATNKNNRMTKLLMTSMAASDLIVGIFLMPIRTIQIVYNGKWILGQQLCGLMLTFTNILCGISAFHILCMALDKYLAVCKPFVYRKLTVRTGYIMIVLSWLIPVGAFGIPTIKKWHQTGMEERIALFARLNICGSLYNKTLILTMCAFIFYLPVCITYLLYCFIFQEISMFFKRAPNYNRNVNRNSNILSSPNRGNDRSVPRRSRRFARNMKAIRTIGTLVVCFTVLCMPMWIFVAVFVYDDYNLPSRVIAIVIWIAQFNSTINPLLY